MANKSLPPVKCRICGEAINRNILVENEDWVMPSRNWYYHKKCYTNWVRGKNDPSIISEEEHDWFGYAWDYLTKDLKILLDFPKVQSQWANFLKKGMTANGIFYALRYFYDVKKGDAEKAQSGIGIVPYVYNDAREYWQKRERIEEGICKKIEEQFALRAAARKIEIEKTKKSARKRGPTPTEMENWEVEDGAD